ncbi:hypothetical protein BDW72DRAFT_210028 [Aspergillus terricola var. indicus]
MPSLRTLALGLGLTLLATTTTAERLRVVWSSGSFSAIGDQTGNYDSFAIIRENGEAIYNDGSPKDKSPCFNTGGGRTFQIEGDCWASGRQFHCLSDFGGSPTNCDVRDANGNVLGTGVGQKDTTFIGISIGIDASCVVEFDSDDAGHCPVDDGHGPLHVTKDNHGDGL